MDFSKVGAYMDTLQEVHVPGCDLVVYKDHEMIYRHMSGFRDGNFKQPMRGDEIYFLYSCSKVFTTCAVMQLIERGLLNLDDPVSRYLPAFKDLKVEKDGKIVPANRVLTIRHLMSMQSGLDYETDTPAIRRVLEETDGQAATRKIVDALAEKPLQFEPGTDFLYSMSHDVLPAIAEVVTGQRFSDYLKEHIFDPLGLATIGYTVKEKDQERVAAQFAFDWENQQLKQVSNEVRTYRISPCYESGGAGLISDVRDYSIFADTLACGGVSKEGMQILSPEMIQLWSANQLGPRSRRTFDEWKRLGYTYALGVRTRVDLTKGGLGTAGEFGWDGAAGSCVFIDPYRHISIFYAMHVLDYGYNYDVIHPRLRHLVYEGLDS